ncbi:MAG TPA: methyltransferase domain-containing protein [Clostridia bacterium]|nr:methyltransferase domain-containing protein [Clostridia bacterium]
MTQASEPVGTRTKTVPHGGYDAAWFEVLAKVEERHFWFRARNNVIAAAMEPLGLELGSNARVLEVGCGNGNVLPVLRKIFPRGRLVGMDLFQEGLNYSRRRCECELVEGDVLHAPFPGGSFDVVGMFDVLEHIENDRAALGALHALLAPGGALVLTVPANPRLWSYFDEVAGHYRRYLVSELAGKLEAIGFQVSRMSHFMATILPLVWAARVGRRHRPVAKESADGFQRAREEFKVRPGINGALLWLLGWERRWISLGRGLPCGTSLLAIARKPRL